MGNVAHAAMVSLIGRPSAGKSTFLNTSCGEKVSIVSPVPQTTRNTVRGIVNGDRGQLVFIDTPGYHESEKKLNRKLQDIAAGQLADADLILYIIDASRTPGVEESLVAELVAPFVGKLFIAVNKIDLPSANPAACRLFAAEKFPGLSPERIFDISAEKDTNINPLLTALAESAPEQQPFYPEEFYTDQEVSFRIAEIIREKAILFTREEIPHCVYVEIEDLEMRRDGRELWCRAFLTVERESQKSMVIGKGASMIKKIRLAAVKDLTGIFPYRVDLDLQVKVNKNWRQQDAVLNRLMQ